MQILHNTLSKYKPTSVYSLDVIVSVGYSDYVYTPDVLDRYNYQTLSAKRFMEKYYSENGRKRIADNTLVALTLMIAESCTEEKDVMVKVVVNLINKENK